ncbi:MAG: alpha/beta hydrolase [Deltaproteobacteria bacterium]|nr:alpha/beta hydrolase [Deltaproteobacteria bacterium]
MSKVTVGTENNQPIELYYEDHGAGKPVVLIHGWPLSGRSWESQVPSLVEAGYRVISYDRRGFGQSSQPWSGYDYKTLTSDLDALMTHLDLKDVTLVGFSMGGGEVAHYVGRFGTERVSKVVFMAAVTPCVYKSPDNPEGTLDDAAIAARQRGVRADRLAVLETFTKGFFSAGGEQRVTEAQRHYAYQMAAFASPQGTHDCIAAFARTDFRPDLKKINIPTLVIHGDSDVIVPFEISGKRTAASIPGAKLVVIKGGPHGINVSHPAEVNQALLAFLSG